MIRGLIFDLDGVIVSTDDLHYQAWQRLANEEGIPFDRATNNRLRGISRTDSLNILLEHAGRHYRPEEKRALADRKNRYYVESLQTLTPAHILPAVTDRLRALRQRGLRLAVASSSRNARTILNRVGLGSFFDAVVDGHDLQRSKPDPEAFLLAARRLGLPPQVCLVVEDAVAGVDAALAAGMTVLALGPAAQHPHAHLRAQSLADVPVEALATAQWNVQRLADEASGKAPLLGKEEK